MASGYCVVQPVIFVLNPLGWEITPLTPLTVSQLVIKLHTNSGADHFLEACSREERDNWAEDIASAVNRLGVAGGDKGTVQDDLAGSQLHNVNLRRDAESAGCSSLRRTVGLISPFSSVL